MSVIIDGRGEYLTRSGKLVRIYEINDPVNATFNCRGNWRKVLSNGHFRWHFCIWTPTGKYRLNEDNGLDVVQKVG